MYALATFAILLLSPDITHVYLSRPILSPGPHMGSQMFTLTVLFLSPDPHTMLYMAALALLFLSPGPHMGSHIFILFPGPGPHTVSRTF
jgi:hypothetical protein